MNSLLMILELQSARLRGKEQLIVINGLQGKEQKKIPIKSDMYYLMRGVFIQDLSLRTRMRISELNIVVL